MHGGVAEPGEEEDAPKSHCAAILSSPCEGDSFGPKSIELLPTGRADLFEGYDPAGKKNENHPRGRDIGELGHGIVSKRCHDGDNSSNGEGNEDELPVCKDCAPTHFQAEAGQFSCEACTACGAGQYAAEGCTGVADAASMLGQKLPVELDGRLQAVYAEVLAEHVDGEDSAETAKLAAKLSAAIEEHFARGEERGVN